MGYTPENNPYIPGDPYSYDLAWMVEEVKKAQQVGENAQASADAALQSQIEAQQAKDLSMAWAIGEDDGGPIPPGEPQYENNSKYYAGQAGTSAQNAAGDAAAAHNSELQAYDYLTRIGDNTSGIVADWLNDHITQPTTPAIDTSLMVAGAAADAKAAGDSIRSIDNIMSFNTWANEYLRYCYVGSNFVRISDTSFLCLNPTPNIPDDMSGITVICPVGYVAQIAYCDVNARTLASTGYASINRLSVPENAVKFNINIAKHLTDTINTSEADNILIIKETKAAMYENSLLNILLSSTTQHGYYDLEFESGAVVQGNQNPAGNAAITPSTTRCTGTMSDQLIPEFRPARPTSLVIKKPADMQYRVTFWNSLESNESHLIATDSNTNWQTNELVEIPTSAITYKISYKYSNDAAITPADLSDVKVILRYGTRSTNLTEEYTDKILSILGDSISTFAGIGAPSAGDGHLISDGTYTYPGNHCRYPNGVITSADMMYWKQLIDELGINLGINDSWAGSRITWNGTESSDQGANIYIASPTRIGHLDDNGTPDIIIVNAGTNDIGAAVTVGTFDTADPKNLTPAEISALPVDTFADAMRALLIRLEKTYPNSKIIFMLPNYTNTYYSITETDEYCEVIKEACDFFGVPYFDCRSIGINIYNVATYLSDGIHYNVAGMNLLYRNLLKYMLYTIGI